MMNTETVCEPCLKVRNDAEEVIDFHFSKRNFAKRNGITHLDQGELRAVYEVYKKHFCDPSDQSEPQISFNVHYISKLKHCYQRWQDEYVQEMIDNGEIECSSYLRNYLRCECIVKDMEIAGDICYELVQIGDSHYAVVLRED